MKCLYCDCTESKVIDSRSADDRTIRRRRECVGCGRCAESCPQHTIQIRKGKAVIDYKNCIRCFCCHEMCPKHVIDIRRWSVLHF